MKDERSEVSDSSFILHPFQNGEDTLAGRSGSRVGIIHVGIQLDGDPALVVEGQDSPEGGGEIDRAFSRNQVMMHTIGRDVFQMEMTNVRRQPRNRRRRLIADAI